jgi:hypothetical protein
MKRSNGFRIQAWEALAPSADADNTHAVDGLLAWKVAGLERYDSDTMAEANELLGESLDVPFQAADDGPVEVAYLQDMHIAGQSSRS